MTQCTQLSERMPEVAKAILRWSPADEVHLAGCPECLAEWDLVRRTASLGSSIPAIDAQRVASEVLAELRAPEPRPSSRFIRWATPLALAAGLILVLVLRLAQHSPDDAGAVTLSLLPEVEGLSDAELESVIRLIPAADPADLRGVDSLSEEELNLMLEDLEG